MSISSGTAVLIFFIFVCAVLLVQQFEEFTLQDDPKLYELKEIIAPMFAGNIKYDGVLDVVNRRDLFNEISFYKGNKSYTINKEKVFLCLKDKQGEYYDNNTLIYVTLHEISHTLSTTVGHDENFNRIFDAILKKAEEMKIYNPKKPIVQDYCPD